MLLDFFLDILRNSILITGLVVIMMMMIEALNIDSHGSFFTGLKSSPVGQVVTSAFLGIIPGCMGGFASVSLYTHRMISFGALVAMMIASSGDESFIMLAMFPKDAMWMFALLFAIAIVIGVLVDKLFPGLNEKMYCGEQFKIHADDCCEQHEDCHGHKHGRHVTVRRVVMLIGTALFIVALALGWLEHEHCEEGHAEGGSFGLPGFNLLSEEWMNVLFSVLSIFILVILVLASDHFVEEHLWKHVVCKHLPVVFAWSFGVLAFLGVILHFFDIGSWISDNVALMIILATLVGIIPESGPHLIFVTLYASGIVPFPVLLASCISQDGHASLPLIAESRSSFFKAKAINCVIALVCGFISMVFV